MDKEEKAGRARAILEDELFKEAILEIRAGCLSQFEASAIEDDDARKVARIQLGAIQQLVGQLELTIERGKPKKERSAP